MIFESALADVLYLNWAIPERQLPPLPDPLRHDTATIGGTTVGFFTFALFRQVGLHARGASWLSMAYPQANGRLCVLDDSGVASIYLLRQLAPAWMVPLARLAARQPLSAAILEFPPRGAMSDPAVERRWKVQAGAGLEIVGRVESPSAGRPDDAHVDAAFFRERSRAYWPYGSRLHVAETDHPEADILRMQVELPRTEWLEIFLPFEPVSGDWRAVHSAFLVPEVRLVFSLGGAPERAERAQPAPAG